MKSLLTISFLFFSITAFTQSNEDYPLPDSATVVDFPWYDNNQFLLNYITSRGYYGPAHTQGRTGQTECLTARYKIPVKIHVYRNNAGDASSNLTEQQALEVFAQANALFSNTNAGIRFYLDEIVFKNKENRRTGISSFTDVIDFFVNERTSGVLNIHMVRTSSFIGGGYAITPFYPSFPLTRWNCYIETGENRTNPQIASTLSHELGHTLGLLHTHHPGRLISLASNDENGTISNGCYQEMVDRDEENKSWRGCVATHNKKKCEINGDFLCDTAADPGQSYEEDQSQVVLKQVTPSPGCQYQNPGFGSDYTEDNMEEDWTPPVSNIMSYSNFTCQNEFTPMQIGQMWYFIEEDFPWEHESQFSGGTLACTGGTSITFTNPPSGIGALSWSVEPANLIDPSTRSGTGNTAFIKAASNAQKGWVDIEWITGSGCNFFSTSSSVWVGRPSSPVSDPTGVPAIQASLSSYVTINLDDIPGMIGFTSIDWWTNDPSSLDISVSPTHAVVECLKTGYNYVYVSATNSCGTSLTRQIPINVPSGGGGGGGVCCPWPQIVINPNPSPDWVNITFQNKEELETYYGSNDVHFKVIVSDLSGNPQQRGVANKNGLKLNLKHLDKGIYLVKVFNKEFEQTSRLIIE